VIWRVDSLLDLRIAYCVPHRGSPEPEGLAFETLVPVPVGFVGGFVAGLEVGAAATVDGVVASAGGAAAVVSSVRPPHGERQDEEDRDQGELPAHGRLPGAGVCTAR